MHLHHRFTLSVVLVSLAACAGEDPAPITAPDATAPADVTVASDAAADSAAPADAAVRTDAAASDAGSADRCNAVCARIVGAPGCMRDMPTCLRACITQVNNTPIDCRAALDTYLACGERSTASCTGGVTNFAGCDDAQSALVVCAAGSDAGTDPCARFIDCASCTANASCGWCNNHCVLGNDTGPTPPNTCGGQPWVRSSSACR